MHWKKFHTNFGQNWKYAKKIIDIDGNSTALGYLKFTLDTINKIKKYNLSQIFNVQNLIQNHSRSPLKFTEWRREKKKGTGRRL